MKDVGDFSPCLSKGDEDDPSSLLERQKSLDERNVLI